MVWSKSHMLRVSALRSCHAAITWVHNFTTPLHGAKKRIQDWVCGRVSGEVWCSCWLWMCGWRSSCRLGGTYVSGPGAFQRQHAWGSTQHSSVLLAHSLLTLCAFSCGFIKIHAQSSALFVLFVKVSCCLHLYCVLIVWKQEWRVCMHPLLTSKFLVAPVCAPHVFSTFSPRKCVYTINFRCYVLTEALCYH